VFEVGKNYRRRSEIHAVYGGQQQGGISTPRSVAGLFLFTGPAGEAYGYRDEFRPDGTFWYTGEGQIGDMEFVRGNRAVRDHLANRKRIFLFEQSGPIATYMGEARHLGHHREQRPDSQGNLRQTIVFELELLSGDSHSEVASGAGSVGRTRDLWALPLSELRDVAVTSAPVQADPISRRTLLRRRSEAVKVYVLRRAEGKCEACGGPAPFLSKRNQPFLESHHILRLSDGGPDDPRHVAAVCPNCHREAHYGLESDALNRQLLERVGALEAYRLVHM